MRRTTALKLRIACSVICLAIVAGMGAMWLRSTTTEDRISLALANRRYHLGSVSHRFYIRGTLSDRQYLRIEDHGSRPARSPANGAHLWPAYQKELFSRTLFIPWWMALAPPAIAGAVASRGLFRQGKGRAARAKRSRKASHSGAAGGSSMRMARRPRASKLRKVA
jgi:hypothetical protein